MLRNLLAHPLTRGMNIDDPRTTSLRRRIIAEKEFLRRIYIQWYQRVAEAIPQGDGAVLELGSGAGFLKRYVPGLITSEVFLCEEIDTVLDATHLPFADGSLRAIAMTDVLHHIPNVRRLFCEAGRCVRPGGVIAMIEPWVTPWSRLIYERLHHEPINTEQTGWEIPSTGPLSAANGALPWILFGRDYLEFHRQFPEWQLKLVEPMMPFCYLVSGGVSMRSLMPGWSYPVWRAAENLLSPWMNSWAMFARIVLERVEDQANAVNDCT